MRVAAASCKRSLPPVEPFHLAVAFSLKVLVQSLVHTGKVDNAADVIQVCLCYLRAVEYEPSLSRECSSTEMIWSICRWGKAMLIVDFQALCAMPDIEPLNSNVSQECSQVSPGQTYISMSMSGNKPMLSAASSEFSTSSLTVVYRHLPGCAQRSTTRPTGRTYVRLNVRHVGCMPEISHCQNQRCSCSQRRTLLETFAPGGQWLPSCAKAFPQPHHSSVMARLTHAWINGRPYNGDTQLCLV